MLPADEPSGYQQGTLVLDRCEGDRHEISPGVVHVSGWLDADRQAATRRRVPRVGTAPGRAAPPAGAARPPDERAVGVPRLALAAVRLLAAPPTTPTARRSSRCRQRSRGWRREPSPTRSGRPAGAEYAPDAAIVNLYAPGARLGLHQDGEEPSAAPVVTISLGDTCVFRLAGVDRRTRPFTDVELRSGDLLVFGGAEPAHLPRRAEGARRHRAPRSRTAARAAQHHDSRNWIR